MSWLSFKATIVVVIIYIALNFIGGGIMMYLESKAVTSSSSSAIKNLTKFQNYIQKKFHISINESEAEETAKFAAKFYTTSTENSTILSDAISTGDLFKWINFCEITLSTIGYGDVVPSTDGGKLFTMFFAAIGIPIHLIMIAALGCTLSREMLKVRYLFRKYILKKDEMPKNDAIMYLVLGFLLLMWLALGGFIASKSQEWTYVNGFYFAFVTLTTIGYGDYVVDGKGSEYTGLSVTVYTTIGLVLAAAVTDAIVKAIGSKAFNGAVTESKVETNEAITSPNRCFDIENKVNGTEDDFDMKEIRA